MCLICTNSENNGTRGGFEIRVSLTRSSENEGLESILNHLLQKAERRLCRLWRDSCFDSKTLVVNSITTLFKISAFHWEIYFSFC